jgi:hypothetical protein
MVKKFASDTGCFENRWPDFAIFLESDLMQEDFRMPSDTQEVTLPSLRPDIDIYAGPLEEDGSPSFVIHDPVTGAFSKIGWGEAAVLLRLRQGQTLSALMEELSDETTLSTTPEEVEALCEDADEQGLTKKLSDPSVPGTARKFQRQENQRPQVACQPLPLFSYSPGPPGQIPYPLPALGKSSGFNTGKNHLPLLCVHRFLFFESAF